MKKINYKLDYKTFENKNLVHKTKPQIWFAFHGIGQNTEAFKNFAIQNNFKIYSFGLFYHEENQTNLKDIRETSLQDWLILMAEFIKKEKIHFQDSSINIIGFSLGSRPALQLISNLSKLPLKPFSINKIVLVAPETLAISKWYRFGTQTILGNYLLKKVISSNSVKKIISSISLLIFSKNAHKLIHYQIYHGINSLALAWLAYRSFEVDKKQWKAISKNHEGKIIIVGSKNDNFVKLKKMQCFVKKNSNDNGKSIKWIISQSPHYHLLKEFKL